MRRMRCRSAAEANVNCRILPGHTPGEVRKVIEGVLAEPKV